MRIFLAEVGAIPEHDRGVASKLAYQEHSHLVEGSRFVSALRSAADGMDDRGQIFGGGFCAFGLVAIFRCLSRARILSNP
jgi:hypothetical protein